MQTAAKNLGIAQPKRRQRYKEALTTTWDTAEHRVATIAWLVVVITSTLDVYVTFGPSV